LIQNRGHWWAVIKMAMKLEVPYNEGNFFDQLRSTNKLEHWYVRHNNV